MIRTQCSLIGCLLLSSALLPLAGCATYEFDLVKPERFATHISRQTEARVAVEPLEYRFITVDNRLVIRIHNPTADVIQLIGNQSAAIDPAGESHPLRSMAIAPGSAIKLVMPPMRPQVYESGPTIGIGFGVASRRSFGDPFRGGAGYDSPRYYTVYDDSDNFFWDWPGQTTARLLLTFGRGEKTFRDEFSVFKRKM